MTLSCKYCCSINSAHVKQSPNVSSSSLKGFESSAAHPQQLNQHNRSRRFDTPINFPGNFISGTWYHFQFRRFSSQTPYYQYTINEIQNKHVQRTCLMYHAACKVEFQPFNRSYSQLTFFIFLCKKKTLSQVAGKPPSHNVGVKKSLWQHRKCM